MRNEDEKECLKILFIGNSHTYYNDMPLLVKKEYIREGFDCHVTMLDHPGWFLTQHACDGEHASAAGSDYAARMIVSEIAHHLTRIEQMRKKTL